MKTTIKYCKTCANQGYFQDGAAGCVLFKVKINPEIDFCSKHIPKNQTIRCELCGHDFDIKKLFYWTNQDDTSNWLVCENCLNKIGTCGTCYYQNSCGFMNDHSEPQYVNRIVQQGFMKIQTQGKNPHLVEKHCTSCRCSCGEDCMRDEQGVNCKNWMKGN